MKEFWGKVSKILLFLTVLLIPTQLGKHFWFDWTSVLGIRIDYFSPTVYLIDLVWLGLFLSNIKTLSFGKICNFKNFLVLIFVLVNILIAQNRWVAVYKWIRLGELSFFIYLVWKNKQTVWRYLDKIIPIWIILESILALGQMAKGGSLDGWWWFLGERKFDFNTIGIARISIVDVGLVRAYGTFSHPNSLAGFLLVCLVWWMKIKPKLSNDKKINFKLIFWWVVFWFGLMGIFFTGSRTVWLLMLGIIVFWLLKEKETIRDKVKFGVLLFVLGLILVKIINFNYPIERFVGGWDQNGILKRGQLNLAAIEMIKETPWVGVGLGNYLVKLPDFLKANHIFWLQPVHNIFLLLLSEIGVLGLMILIWWLSKIKWKRLIDWDWIILGVILITGMVDHYWFTLPQNMWLLALVVGVI